MTTISEGTHTLLNSMTRRSFAGALALGASKTILGQPFQASEAPPGAAIVSVTINPKKKITTVPVNYGGLSYESAQFANPEFFAPTNKALVALFRRLAKQGVLRTGGNTSEFTVWSPAGSVAGAATTGAVDPDGNSPRTGGVRRHTPVTPKAIQNLAAFLDATGWQLIYGLNLGTGSPEQAAQEAKAVSDAVGRRLITFQIGNEPDLFHRNRPSDLRPPDWNFSSYLFQWREFSKAVRKAVPHASFGAPDIANVASNMEWIEEFAEQAGSEVCS